MPYETLIKDKKTWNPSKLIDEILLDDHRILHAWWATESKGTDIKDWSKEDIFNAHELAAQEMIKRKLGVDDEGKHASPLTSTSQFDQPFPAWQRDGKAGEYGPMIFLPNILSAFTGDYMLCEEFVTIVGGLCNHGRTKGDIDILLKCPEQEDKSPLGMALKFRIARSLARIGINEERLQFLYNDFSGPFTNHVHLFDLILRLKCKRELHEMSSEMSSVMPFRFIVQPKPIMGRFEEEIFSPETIVEVIKTLRNWGEDEVKKGVFVEVKRDGFRIQVHKVGDKIKIMTEEGNDITIKLPSIVGAVEKINKDFIAEGEVELWMGGKHQNRADASSVITSKEVPEREKNLTLSFYDLMWLNGKDVHSLTFEERHNLLIKAIPNDNIASVNESILVNSLEKLKSEIIKASKKPGSEGAMIKKRSYIYPLKLHTSDMIKFKNEFSLNLQVLDLALVKGSKNTFSYWVGLKGGVPAGKTFNTDIQVPKGGFLEVVFVEISKNIDPKSKKVFYNMFAPRVVGKATKADSVVRANELVDLSGGQIKAKPFPKKFDELEDDSYIDSFLQMSDIWDKSEEQFALSYFEEFPSTAELQKEQPPVLDLPEEKKPYPFVIQEHIRGKSAHLDIRLAVNSHLIGFTLDDPGRVGDPLRFSDNAEKSTDNKVLAQAKARQPKAWLKVSGDIAPGEVGATRNLPARFKILDSGTYEMGAQKAYFMEVFLKGKRYNGRFVFRKLPRPSDTDKAGKEPFVWFVWKPIDQSPYILSTRSISEDFVPPQGRSALPKEWEDKIPPELKWWEKGWTGSKAIESITAIRKILLQRNILCLEKLNFTIQKKWWKGQKVIRDMPVEFFCLNFSNGISFDIDSNPLISDVMNGSKKTATDKEMNFEGQISAGETGNPNKEIPLTVEILDRGKVEEIESAENFLSWNFSGSKLKGFWIAKTKDGGWLIEKSQEAAMPKKLSNTELTSSQIADIKTLIKGKQSLSDIARLVGCSKSSVIYHSR